MANLQVVRVNGKADYKKTVQNITRELNKIVRKEIKRNPDLSAQLHTYSAKDVYSMILKQVESQKGTPEEGTTSVYKEVRRFNSLLTEARKSNAFKVKTNKKGAVFTNYSMKQINRDVAVNNQVSRTLADKYMQEGNKVMLKELGLNYKTRPDFTDISPAQLNKVAQQVAAYPTPESREYNVMDKLAHNWLHALEQNASELFQMLDAKYHFTQDGQQMYKRLDPELVKALTRAIMNDKGEVLSINYIYLAGNDSANVINIIKGLHEGKFLSAKEAKGARALYDDYIEE